MEFGQAVTIASAVAGVGSLLGGAVGAFVAIKVPIAKLEVRLDSVEKMQSRLDANQHTLRNEAMHIMADALAEVTKIMQEIRLARR